MKVTFHCKKELHTFCRLEHPRSGHAMDCLLKHMHDNDFGTPCRTQLENEQKVRSTSILFVPGLLKKCSAAYEGFVKKGNCTHIKSAFDGSEEDKPAFPAVDPKEMRMFGKTNNGQAITCLTRMRNEIKDSACKQVVWRQMRRQSNDIRSK